MRRSRVRTLWGAIGALAWATLALTFPGSGSGRPAAPVAAPERITVGIGQTATTQTVFDAKTRYTVTVGGTITIVPTSFFTTPGWIQDPFFRWDADKGDCSGAIAGARLSLTDSRGANGDYVFPELLGHQCRTDHTYVGTVNGDSSHPDMVGKVTISTSPSTCPENYSCTGSYTVEITPSERVDFGVHHTSHTVLSHRNFFLTTTKGLGQLEVPAPKPGQTVSSTTAKGAIKFSALKFSPHDVLLLDEETLYLRVMRGDFITQENGESRVYLDVTVSKSKGKESCPVGQDGRVVLGDLPADEVSVSVPGCHIDASFVDGQERAKVTVGIHVEQPPPPPQQRVR
jgi:hypothetical protein